MSEQNKEKSKKGGLGNLNLFLVIPFYLIGVDIAFTTFYYMAFAGAKTKTDIVRIMNYNSGILFSWNAFSFLFLLTMFAAWYYPVWRIGSRRNPEDKKLLINKFAYVYRTVFNMFAAAFGAGMVAHLVVYRNVIDPTTFLKFNFPAIAISYAVQFAFTLIYLDTIVFGTADALMKTLYAEEELYKMRDGYHISIVKKLALMVVSAAVTPVALIYVFVNTTDALNRDQVDALSSLIINGAFVPVVLSSALLISGISKPISELIKKMKRLSEGDFDVKSRIYFTDEIAQIKASFNVMADQLREREQLRETFGKFVSIEVARELMKSGKTNLGGDEIEATVMFCDIRNFTSRSEKMSAGEVVEMLNAYFSYVTRPIMENRGVINKFIGDAVMAIFTPALGSDSHASDAMKAALGMRDALGEFNRSAEKYAGVRFGIGVHTGRLVAGNVGTSQRLEYTVIGDTVNIASRLESQTKEARADILVSKAVRDRTVGEFGEDRFEEVGPVSLKGKTALIDIYKVL